MPKPAFICIFCDGLYSLYQDCKDHETICDFNPKLKKCESCKYVTKSIPGDDSCAECANCKTKSNWEKNTGKRPDDARLEKFHKRWFKF